MNEQRKLRVVSWSGGKDSTATIILAHEHGIPLDLIVMGLLWFDKKRGIYAEHPEHLAWVKEYAKPLFESWGYKVELVDSKRDYMSYFYQVRQESQYPEYVGKYYGWIIGGMCKMSGEKPAAVKAYLKSLNAETEEYIGIGIDEPERLERLRKQRGKISLLERFGKTTADAREICRPYGLISPNYEITSRGGCWFCPNQKIKELAYLKVNHPEYWDELLKLDAAENTIQRCFSYSKTFSEIAAEVDEYIANPPPEPPEQLTLFDIL